MKPLGYVRYGDDFIVLAKTQQQALTAQKIATAWLKANLRLCVHDSNNIVIRTNQGLVFLGHYIYSLAPVSVDRAMSRKIRQGINPTNIASYGAMQLPRRRAKQLPWLLRDKLS
jgi:hypothetical protein